MSLLLFNTLSRKKEVFKPLQPGQVRLYCCGPTVYHFAHIGNLRTYLFEDLLVRVLRREGYDVVHTMNITDVGHLTSDGDEGEDKMEAGAAREGKTAWQIAEDYTRIFFEDCSRLNCLKPSIVPKATEHIQEMIDLILGLEKKGFTYQTNDGIYYNTSKFGRYADFARLDTKNLQEGARVSIGEKRLPTDFALWKFSPVGQKRQMEWDSPWGRGFPGWHIECSAMAMKYLGETFDIHCGGIDHIPVHHTNEIAQSEAVTGKVFSRYWMHGEFLTEKHGKMSKSSGGFLTLRLLEDRGYKACHFRFLVLQAHYRSELQFDWESLTAAKNGFEGLLQKIRALTKETADQVDQPEMVRTWMKRFEDHLRDDLNSAASLAVLFEVIRSKELSSRSKWQLIHEFDEYLGLNLISQANHQQEEVVPLDVEAVVQDRQAARLRKDFKESDRLRDILLQKGYRVEDSPDGQRLKKI